MKNFRMILFMFFVFLNPAYGSNKITIINAGSPTGSTMEYSKVLIEELAKRKIQSEIIVVGDNCAQAKSIWKKPKMLY